MRYQMVLVRRLRSCRGRREPTGHVAFANVGSAGWLSRGCEMLRNADPLWWRRTTRPLLTNVPTSLKDPGLECPIYWGNDSRLVQKINLLDFRLVKVRQD